MSMHTADTCEISTHDHFGQIEAAQNVGTPITCKHCGNEVEQRVDPTGQRTDAWAQKVWDDDRDFQCGLNPESNRHEPDDELRCGDCGAPMHYDRADENYHHNDPALSCFLIPRSS